MKKQTGTTTIELRKKTRDKLARLGHKGQTFDVIVVDMLNHLEKCDRYWSDKFD